MGFILLIQVKNSHAQHQRNLCFFFVHVLPLGGIQDLVNNLLNFSIQQRLCKPFCEPSVSLSYAVELIYLSIYRYIDRYW